MASMEKEKLLVKGSNPLQPLRLSSGVLTMALVGSWYCTNIGVLLLNKYLLSNYGFRFPIFLTMCHMTACSLFSYVAIAWLKMVPMQPIRSRVQFMKISALSVIFCTSVVNGNISLRYLPVSFNQAIGATTPFFTAVFAYFMTVKRESWLTYLTLVPVVTGVVIASGGEPSFHLYGFIMCILATAARALKSVLQGLLLSSEGEKLNSMNLLLYMAPIAVVLLLPATLLMEPNVLGITIALARQDVKIIYYLLFNSALAYFVNLTNFLVTKHTSPLTLQDDDDRVDMAPPPPPGPLVPRFHGSTPTAGGSSSSAPVPRLPQPPSSSLPPRGGPPPRSIRGGRRRD